MTNELLINTTRSTYQTYTETDANGASQANGTDVADVAESSESYQNCLKATEVIKMLSQEEPVRERALATAKNNQQTALMAISQEMKTNSNYANENPKLMTLLNEVEAATQSSSIGDHLQENLNVINEQLDKSINTGYKYSDFQKAYLALFDKGKYNLGDHKDKEGVPDGHKVDFAKWLTDLRALMRKVQGSDGMLGGNLGSREDALDWATGKEGPGFSIEQAERCLVKYESPPGSGTYNYRVMIDIKPLQDMETSLIDLQKKQGDVTKGGFLDPTLYSALEGMLEITQQNLNTQTTATMTVVTKFKDLINAAKEKMAEAMNAEVNWFNMINR